ncbi:unnamed protein product [Arabis nemorensis]|uniref:Uncharacterized protein n=1 Tax=Arabis nemorensis TaxID=586526 RepID=A0A565BM47_9BRAS|nr:unnamed protein product [Arabis nemorensis]
MAKSRGGGVTNVRRSKCQQGIDVSPAVETTYCNTKKNGEEVLLQTGKENVGEDGKIGEHSEEVLELQPTSGVVQSQGNVEDKEVGETFQPAETEGDAEDKEIGETSQPAETECDVVNKEVGGTSQPDETEGDALNKEATSQPPEVQVGCVSRSDMAKSRGGGVTNVRRSKCQQGIDVSPAVETTYCNTKKNGEEVLLQTGKENVGEDGKIGEHSEEVLELQPTSGVVQSQGNVEDKEVGETFQPAETEGDAEDKEIGETSQPAETECDVVNKEVGGTSQPDETEGDALNKEATSQPPEVQGDAEGNGVEDASQPAENKNVDVSLQIDP